MARTAAYRTATASPAPTDSGRLVDARIWRRAGHSAVPEVLSRTRPANLHSPGAAGQASAETGGSPADRESRRGSPQAPPDHRQAPGRLLPTRLTKQCPTPVPPVHPTRLAPSPGRSFPNAGRAAACSLKAALTSADDGQTVPSATGHWRSTSTMTGSSGGRLGVYGRWRGRSATKVGLLTTAECLRGGVRERSALSATGAAAIRRQGDAISQPSRRAACACSVRSRWPARRTVRAGSRPDRPGPAPAPRSRCCPAVDRCP